MTRFQRTPIVSEAFRRALFDESPSDTNMEAIETCEEDRSPAAVEVNKLSISRRAMRKTLV